MIFLEPLYQWLVVHVEGKINHFPLLRLIVFSLDHTITLFLGWFVVWLIYWFFMRSKRGQVQWRFVIYRHLFVFYLILLFQLTVFRTSTSMLNVSILAHSFNDIQWVPFVDSIKLFFKGSKFAAYYNVFGNIFWFVPLGIYCSLYSDSTNRWKKAFWWGLILSFSIEAGQFLFYTGISHIDDIFCNVLGSLFGVYLYQIFHR